MRHYKQFLLFKNITHSNFELVRMNSLPFVNIKVSEKLKLVLQKAAKEQKKTQRSIVINALEKYLIGDKK